MQPDKTRSSPPDKRMVFPLSTHGKNIGEAERAASVFLGGALWVTAFKRQSPATLLGAVVGTICLMRGTTGHSRLYQWFGLDSAHDTTPVTDGERASDAPLARPSKPRNPGDPSEVSSFITIGADAKRLYDLWLEPNTMNQILGHVAHIEAQNDGAMHWRADLPLGRSVEWTTQTTDKKAGEFVAWQSAPDAPLQSSGRVEFKAAPGNRGTEVHLHARFEPPLGALGEAAAKFLEIVPATAASKALRNFKALVETGEIPTLKGNVSARGSGDSV